MRKSCALLPCGACCGAGQLADGAGRRGRGGSGVRRRRRLGAGRGRDGVVSVGCMDGVVENARPVPVTEGK